MSNSLQDLEDAVIQMWVVECAECEDSQHVEKDTPYEAAVQFHFDGWRVQEGRTLCVGCAE